MSTTIDEKLTITERLETLLRAGHAVVLRRRGERYEIATACVTDDADLLGAWTQDLESLLCEGVPHEIEFSLEQSCGATLGEALRCVLDLNRLPY